MKQAKNGRAYQYGISGRKFSLDVEQPSRLLHEALDRLRQRRRYKIPIGNQASALCRVTGRPGADTFIAVLGRGARLKRMSGGRSFPIMRNTFSRLTYYATASGVRFDIDVQAVQRESWKSCHLPATQAVGINLPQAREVPRGPWSS